MKITTGDLLNQLKTCSLHLDSSEVTSVSPDLFQLSQQANVPINTQTNSKVHFHSRKFLPFRLSINFHPAIVIKTSLLRISTSKLQQSHKKSPTKAQYLAFACTGGV
jgi:hypothetical protein